MYSIIETEIILTLYIFFYGVEYHNLYRVIFREQRYVRESVTREEEMLLKMISYCIWPSEH
jgi:hypothetical protein